MNSLSWMLYLADILPHFSFVFFLLGVLCGVGTVCFGCFLVTTDTNYGERTPEQVRECHKDGFRVFKVGLSLVALLITLGAFVPDQKTMYLIAASQTGEAILNNSKVVDITSKSYQVIDKFLNDQLKETKEKVTETK